METKKQKIVSAVATMGIVLTLFGSTYAYFASRTDAGKTTDVEITANTVDVFSFETGDPISLSLDQESFAEGKGDKSGSTFAKATLTPNNKTNTATDNYYVYLNISNNTFDYSLGSDKPEILLQVTDADGTTVTSLDGLTYSTVTNGSGESVSGFDITTKTGLITLANNKEITANTDTKEETWNIRVVFVNYNENQADNAGNSFGAKLVIQKEKLTLTDYVVAQYTGTQGENNLYYHDSTLENGAGDNSYRYAGSSDTTNNFVCFGSDEETCPDDNLYRIIGVFGDQVKLIKWDYATSDLLGTDGDSNGACSTNTYCVDGINGNYYKGSNTAANIGAYWWNYDGTTNGTNTWSASELNTVNLNTNFLNNIGIEWANKIATTTWKVGGNTGAGTIQKTASVAYTNEYTNPAKSTTVNAKIGLMYTSDYGFAASPSAWTKNLWSLWYVNDNWMYMGLNEWTLVREWSYSERAFNVKYGGYLESSLVGSSTSAWGVRPVFYLNSSINCVSGDGSKNLPIRIN